MTARNDDVPHSRTLRNSKRLMRISITAVLLIVSNPIPSAQLAQMKPGAETQRLNFLLGTWLTEESQIIAGTRPHGRSTSTYVWLPGDAWLRGAISITGLPGSETMHAWTQFTFDARSQEFVMVHTDNQSALVFEPRGAGPTRTGSSSRDRTNGMGEPSTGERSSHGSPTMSSRAST